MNNPCFINTLIAKNNDKFLTFAELVQAVGGNTGNSYITYSLYKHLYNGYKEGTAYYNDFYGHKKPDMELIEKINSHSHAFVILQDYIRPKRIYFKELCWNFFTEFIKALKVPVVIPNIGINDYYPLAMDLYQEIPDEIVRFLKVLSDHSEYIGVRGAITQEVLHKLGIDNTIITGCPSYFETGRNRVIKKHKNIKDKDILTTFPYTLNQSKYPGVCQGDRENFIIEALTFDENALFRGNININVINAYKKEKLSYFTNMEEWKKYAGKFKIIAGRRIHGSIIGINSGLCPVTFADDLRAKEMYEYFRLPLFPIADFNRKIMDVYEECDYSEANKIYNTLYDNWVDFIHKNKCLMYYENDLANKKENSDYLYSAKLYKSKFSTTQSFLKTIDKVWLPNIKKYVGGGKFVSMEAHFKSDFFSKKSA